MLDAGEIGVAGTLTCDVRVGSGVAVMTRIIPARFEPCLTVWSVKSASS